MSPYTRITSYCPICHQVMYSVRVLSSKPTACGDPRITCPNCHADTVDDHVLELALRPKQWYETHYMKKTVYIPLLIMPFALIMAFALIGMQFEAVRRLPALLLGVIIVAILVGGCVPGFRYMMRTCDVKPGTAEFEVAYWESEKRLRDPEYKRFLIDSGYPQRRKIDIIL